MPDHRQTISKSSFLKGLQCQKALYLSKFRPELRDEISALQQAVFDSGTRVGILAQQLFPGGVDAGFQTPDQIQEAIDMTMRLVRLGTPVIYEAGFSGGDLHCFVDILVHDSKGWHAYEVKSSASITDTNYWDASFQWYVMEMTGLDLVSISLVHINNRYVRVGGLDMKQLFNIVPATDVVRQRQHAVKAIADDLKTVLAGGRIPDTSIGPHCTVPYECDFRGHCWQNVPKYSIFDIAELKADKKWDLHTQGILDLKSIPADYPLGNRQWQQVKAELEGTVTIHRDAIRRFLEGLKYPLYFLDFESFQAAVPPFDHSHPYQQIVFQYSLHILDSPGAEVRHKAFLAEASGDPRIPFITSLLRDTGTTGDILVFNRGFEATCLRGLGRDFPGFSAPLEMLIRRLVDLMPLFKNRDYYTPAMRGSYSIKQVLPAVVPGFSYGGMVIADGSEASRAFASLYDERDDEKIMQVRDHLLAYCHLDTLAMVKIVEALDALTT
jgi:hypothetical protein